MVQGVLIDLSGVVYEGGSALPGAAEALARLRAAGLPLRFITNTTRKPKRLILDALAAMDLDIAADEVFTPASAARQMLVAEGLTPHLLIHPALEEEFQDLPSAGPPALIVGDAADGFTFDAMNKAFRVLEDSARFLALAKNRSFLDRDGKRTIDAGAFVLALEYASERTATVLGKPSPAFFTAALLSMGMGPREAAMVGDDAEADVAGARMAGIGAALLVKTGKYRNGDEARYRPNPTMTVADLGAAADWILTQN